jgi:hypothetical protein
MLQCTQVPQCLDDPANTHSMLSVTPSVMIMDLGKVKMSLVTAMVTMMGLVLGHEELTLCDTGLSSMVSPWS